MNYTVGAESMAILSAWRQKLSLIGRFHIDAQDLELCAQALDSVLRDGKDQNGKTWDQNREEVQNR